jgi:hypothetical protein
MNRAEFEKWAFAQYGDAISLSHDGLLYAAPFVQTLFIGWQAAKEQYAPREAALEAALGMVFDEIGHELDLSDAQLLKVREYLEAKLNAEENDDEHKRVL